LFRVITGHPAVFVRKGMAMGVVFSRVSELKRIIAANFVKRLLFAFLVGGVLTRVDILLFNGLNSFVQGLIALL
jgi:hypothetical protein